MVEKGIVKAQKLIADTLQFNKLVVNTSVDQKDPTIGNGQINVNELNTYVLNNQVSTTTKIFVTPEMPVALGICETHAQPEMVENVERPQGFRVCMNATSSQIVKFSWWIVETVSDGGTGAAPTPTETIIPTSTPLSSIAPSGATGEASSETPASTVTLTPSETPAASPEIGPISPMGPIETPSVSPEPEIGPTEEIGPISPIGPIETPLATPVATTTPTPSPEIGPISPIETIENQ